MAESKMPERIFAWDGPGSGWNDRVILNEVRTTTYIRADLVEPLVGALDGLVQRFDTFDGQPFVNPADSPWSIARAAIAAYREAAQ